ELGMLMFYLPPEAGLRWGGLPAAPGGDLSARHGLVLMAGRGIRGKLRVNCALEHAKSNRGLEMNSRDEVRLEISRRIRGGGLKASWKRLRKIFRPEGPYPPFSPPLVSITDNATILCSGKINRKWKIRFSIGFPRHDGNAGYVISPSLEARFLSGRIKLNSSLALYRSQRGKVIFHYYEPVIPGGYPWKTVSGRGEAAAWVMEFSFRRVHLLGKITTARGRAAEADIQMSFYF
ncbi:MAG: hypothetical protein JXB45_06830, partial [Candidatus Krumholzibacteriota bacterium]|nr:hypothetical protein [Candidatus Krumholzibacteriota bacterium]